MSAERPPTIADWAASALLLVGDAAVISHHTAARLWGGTVPRSTGIHVSLAAGSYRAQRAGLVVHTRATPPATRLVQGLVTTTPEQTFLDLARGLTFVDLVVLGDSMVSAGVTTPRALVLAADTGGRRTREAAAMVRVGAESPPETWLRLLVVLGGMPEPEVNGTIVGPGGRPVYRLDLAWKKILLGLEYDGRHHAEDACQWHHDIDRRQWFESQGWRLLQVTSRDTRHPAGTLARICQAARERGLELPTGVPGTAWRRHLLG